MNRRERRGVTGFLRQRGQAQFRDMMASQIQKGIRKAAAHACEHKPNDPRTPAAVLSIYQGSHQMSRLIQRAGITDDEIKQWAAEQIPLGEEDYAEKKAQLKRRQEIQEVTGERKIGRNEACPCGSGRKYKKCCGR